MLDITAETKKVREDMEKQGYVLTEEEYQIILEYTIRKSDRCGKGRDYVPLLLEDEIKNNGFIRYYQRKQTDGTVYYVVKNGMRVRAAVMAYTVPDYAEAKLQELVAMLAETHIGEQEEPEQTFDDLNAEKDSEQQE